MTILAYPIVLASIITMLVAIGITVAVFGFLIWLAIDFIVSNWFSRDSRLEIDYDGYNPQVDKHVKK